MDALVGAIERGDRAYLRGLGLTTKQVNHLLNNTPQFKMTFGTAAELAVEQAVRADPFLSEYVKRGPVGNVPRGAGKPDWRIETPSSSIAVDLMTPQQVEEKLDLWRRQSPRGRPKAYVEKGLNITYDRPAGLKPQAPPPPGTPAGTSQPAATPTVAAAGAKASGLRTAGRLLGRQAPGVVLQGALMFIFPPRVNFHNDKAAELSREKLDSAVEEALAKQEPLFYEMRGTDFTKSIYANVTTRLDYTVAAGRGGDLELYLKDITLLELKLSHENVSAGDAKFKPGGSRVQTTRLTYSILLYEPEFVKLDREWARRQREYQECLQEFGTGSVPHPAGVDVAEDANRHPESGPCIQPRMEPMEGP